MAENEGCRRTVEAFVVCTSPDVCWTQVGDKKVLIPYQIYAKFTDVVFDVPTVRFAGENSVNMDTRITTVYGDEEGIHGGEISGVNKGWCRPITHSTTIRVNGSYLIYHTSTYWMNCNGPDGPGNTKGEVQFFADGMAPYGGPLVDLEKLREEEEKSWWEKASPWVHGALDIVGLIPGFGEIADGANALIYLAEGDYTMAAISGAAMIPFAGWGATGAKVSIKVSKEIAEQGTERLVKEVAEEGLERTGKEGVEELSERTAKESAEGSAEASAKQAAADGAKVSWSTARRRYWKKRAEDADPGEFSPENLERMRQGKAPQHDELGVSKELHHKTPQRDGGSHDPDNLIEVWPWEHDAIDPFRHYRGPQP